MVTMGFDQWWQCIWQCDLWPIMSLISILHLITGQLATNFIYSTFWDIWSRRYDVTLLHNSFVNLTFLMLWSYWIFLFQNVLNFWKMFRAFQHAVNAKYMFCWHSDLWPLISSLGWTLHLLQFPITFFFFYHLGGDHDTLAIHTHTHTPSSTIKHNSFVCAQAESIT